MVKHNFRMKLQLVAILALVVFLLIAVFAIVSQRRAMATCQSDNEEMSKKLQEISFKLREAERIKEEGDDEVESKVKEQEQTIADLKANFEASLNRKNEHLSQLTTQLRQTENANQMLMAEVQRLQAQVQQMAGASTAHGSGQAQGQQPQNVPPAGVKPAAASAGEQPPAKEGATCNLATGQCSAPTAQDQQETITSQPTFSASMFTTQPPAHETVVAEHTPTA